MITIQEVSDPDALCNLCYINSLCCVRAQDSQLSSTCVQASPHGLYSGYTKCTSNVWLNQSSLREGLIMSAPFFLSCSKCWHSYWLHKSIRWMFWIPHISWPLIITVLHVQSTEQLCWSSLPPSRLSCSGECVSLCISFLYWLPSQLRWLSRYVGNLMTSLDCAVEDNKQHLAKWAYLFEMKAIYGGILDSRDSTLKAGRVSECEPLKRVNKPVVCHQNKYCI